MDKDLVALRAAIAMMANELFEVIEIPFEETTELQRQVLATFAFGMLFPVCRMKNLPAPDIHALTMFCLMDVFKYAPHQAVSFSEDLIAHARDGDSANTSNAIIHRGIDGHAQWGHGNKDALRANVMDILRLLHAEKPLTPRVQPGDGDR